MGKSYNVRMSEITVRARNLRKNPTEAEAKLWKHIRNMQLGLKFRRQYPIIFFDNRTRSLSDLGNRSEKNDKLRQIFWFFETNSTAIRRKKAENLTNLAFSQ